MKPTPEIEKEASRTFGLWLADRGLSLQRGILYVNDQAGNTHVLYLNRRPT